jgi:GDPmannose 4,6-dehydratase
MPQLPVWKGTGLDEKGIDRGSGDLLVEVDPRYFRPTEVDLLIGDPRKAHNKLGWRHRMTFDELVQDMIESDLAAIRLERQRHGRAE